jgi:ubiquinone/menaquinone biosynthesis C-methylase UbiE
MSVDYSNPSDYWNERAKTSGLSAPGLAGTTANDEQVFKTIDQIGNFDSLLDFGCGTGRLYSTLSKHCKQYWGIDFSEEMIALFSKTYPRRQFDFILHCNLTVPLGEPEGISLKVAVFDAAVSNMVLQHIVELKQWLQAIENLKSLIKKGGTVYIHECMFGDPAWPNYSWIVRRPIYQYQAAFKPEFDLQIQSSYVKYHTLLSGTKLL